MAIKRRGACMACRVRKVKCIPGTPRCARCIDLGIDDCKYISVKKRGAGNTLRTGEACTPCRRRKAKCDAKRPCTACVNGARDSECVYETQRRSRSTATNVTFVSSDKESRVLGAPNSPFQTPTDGFSEPRISPPPVPLLTWFHSSEPNSPVSPSVAPCERPSSPMPRLAREPLSCPHNEMELGLSPDISVVWGIQGTTKHVPCLTGSSFTILPSIHFQTIPRPLRVPLSLVPPEHVQVSSVAGNDLDMTFRLRSLCRMNKLGLYFGAEKQEAVLRGDTSNVVVDRYFVYGFQAIGMHLCEAPDASPAMVRLQARHCQRAWETLVDIYRTDDQRLKAQGVLLLVDSLIVMGFTATAPLYLLKLCEIINEANLRFLPVYGRPPELCDQVREDIAVLSQTIYLENYFYLTLGGSVPTMTTRLEREFCQDLQRAYPLLFNICPLTMRTQSVLLVRDATLALNSHSADYSKVHHLVLVLDRFSGTLMDNLQRFIETEDTSNVGTIWTCCIICLAHLAALCHLTSQTEPTSRDLMVDLCDLTLEKLGSLSYQVHTEEYSHFDALTGISWKRALEIIDARIESHSHPESEPLRHWRGVIEMVYIDFQTSPLGYGPNSLVSLALSVDGRTEDSSYPNLLIPEERELCGL